MSTAIGGRCERCGRPNVHGHEKRCLAMYGLPPSDVTAVENFAAKIAVAAQARKDELAALEAVVSEARRRCDDASAGWAPELRAAIARLDALREGRGVTYGK